MDLTPKTGAQYVPVSDLGRDIIEAIIVAGRPQTEYDVLKAVRGKMEDKRRVLRELLAAGRIRRAGGGKRNDPYLYSIPPDGDVPPPKAEDGWDDGGGAEVSPNVREVDWN